MVGCAAYGCTNRSEKGFLMKKFPKDPTRRKIWSAKVRRDGWTPTDNSMLCEMHFEESMWEKTREDGSRKLKHDAVPTIFSFVPIQKKRKPPTERFPAKKRILSDVENTSDNTNVDVNFEPKPVASTSRDIEFSDNSNDCSVHSLSCNVLQSNADLLNRLKQYDDDYKKLLLKNNKYKQEIRKLKNEKNCLERQPSENTLLRKVFNGDQIEALRRTSTRFMKWSNATLKNALKLKFSCGNNGYNELIRQKIPLPSLRTLRRRMENLKFDSGILNEVFDFLSIKIDSFTTSHQKHCVIVIDEMAITPANIYDTSLNKYFGNVTLPNHSGIANHALVIMLGGVSSRWKQTVAYYFTGDSIDGCVLKNILLEVITKTEELGLRVISITSDMGGSNRALWRLWNITAGRYSKIKNYITHPLDQTRKIYIFADVPHLFKNIKSMLINNNNIKIPVDLQQKYDLPTDIICANHIQDLICHQESLRFQLAPKLTQKDLTPNHFQTMRVSTSTHVISHDVSSGLKFLADELNKPEYKTTAWFIDKIEEWFKIMTSRHPTFAISKQRPEIYNNVIKSLTEIIDIFSKIQIGGKNNWKPSQTGLLISTQSVLDIQELFLNDEKYEFLLTSRFTQDCLENLFSVLRSKQIIPNASQFKNNLKLICVSQFLTDISRGSYDKDDRQFISDFLDIAEQMKACDSIHEVILPIHLEEAETPEMSCSELNSLYNICGYIISSIKKTTKICQNCVDSVGSNTFDNSLQFSKLTNIKCFGQNTLFFCNNLTFEYFCELEKIFIKYWKHIKDQNINIKSFYLNMMQSVEANHIASCHMLKKQIINRFLIFRLKIASKKKFCGINSKFSSKSVAMHNL